MNFRKEKLAELVFEKLKTLKLEEDELVLITLPRGLTTSQSNIIGQSIVDALRGMGQENPVLLMPDGVGLHAVNEDDMKELGWVRDAKSRKHKSTTDRDETTTTSSTQPTDEHGLHEIWKSVMANLAGKAEKGEAPSTIFAWDLPSGSSSSSR